MRNRNFLSCVSAVLVVWYLACIAGFDLHACNGCGRDLMGSLLWRAFANSEHCLCYELSEGHCCGCCASHGMLSHGMLSHGMLSHGMLSHGTLDYRTLDYRTLNYGAEGVAVLSFGEAACGVFQAEAVHVPDSGETVCGDSCDILQTETVLVLSPWETVCGDSLIAGRDATDAAETVRDALAAGTATVSMFEGCYPAAVSVSEACCTDSVRALSLTGTDPDHDLFTSYYSPVYSWDTFCLIAALPLTEPASVFPPLAPDEPLAPYLPLQTGAAVHSLFFALII